MGEVLTARLPEHLLSNVLSRSAMKSSSSLVSPSLAAEDKKQRFRLKREHLESQTLQ